MAFPRLIHRLNRSNINSLSPRNFHAAVLFTCPLMKFWRQCVYRRGKPKRERKGPSELERLGKGHVPGTGGEGSGKPPAERVFRHLGRWRWTGSERLSRSPSGDRFGKASGSGFGHDARTASEHLTPLPVLRTFAVPQNERGPSAFAAGPARQGCDRVISTYGATHIVPILEKQQHMRRPRHKTARCSEETYADIAMLPNLDRV